MRKFVRRDKNHGEIVAELEKLGVQAIDLAASGGGLTDLVTYHRGNTVFMEVKTEQKDAHIKKTQIWFLGAWRGHCGIVRNTDEAWNLAVTPGVYGLTQAQKNKLLAYHATMTAKTMRLNTILKLLSEV